MRRLPKRKLILPILSVVVFLSALFFVALGYVNRQWDGQSRYTKIYLSSHLVVESFDPKSNQGVKLVFPDELIIESISGRGSWAAGVISKAGTSKWAADSVANYLGIAYTGLAGHFTWWDDLQWKLKSGSVDWTEIKVEDTSALEKFTTPDGVQAYKLSRGWDNKANQWFFDETIESKLLGVVIVNTTDTPGLGASASRVVESMGFKVRDLSTSDEEVTNCVLATTPELKSTLAVKKLQKTFACSWQTSSDQDLKLVLGDQYRSWKTGD
jgi:hypothetical protein